MQKLRTWREFLIEKLTNPEKAISYLQVSLEEYLVDGDTAFFLKGVRNVVEAQGGITEVAKHAGMTPEALSEFLYSGDPLSLGTLSTVLKALGWHLAIQPLSVESATSEQLPLSGTPLETNAPQTAESPPP